MKKNTLQSKKVQKQTKILANQEKLDAIQRKRLSIVTSSKKSRIKTQPSSTEVSLRSPTITDISSGKSWNIQFLVNQHSIDNVDIYRIRTTWISWYNDVRSSLGLSGYIYDSRLDKTAYDWNRVFASGHWLNHHTRNPWDGYYNFEKIDAWFLDRGINPKVVNHNKHTENVGYWYYSCNQSDCTDELISAIRSTFDFYMSEKGKSYDAHYRSIVNPYFSKIGFDIIVEPTERRYYLTVHYITE